MTPTDAPSLPKVRGDLTVLAFRRRAGDPVVILRDHDSGAVFELEEREHFICQQFDGATSLDDVLDRFEARFDTPLSREALQSFVDEIGERGLLAGSTPPRPGPGAVVVDEVAAEDERRGVLWKRALCHPDRVLGWLAPAFRWCFTPWFAAAVLIPWAVAVSVSLARFQEMCELVVASLATAFLPLAGLYLAIQFASAVVQGLAARALGARVPEIGVYIRMLLPRFYCHMTGGAWLREGNHRITVRLAPVAFGLGLWALAVLAWGVNEPGSGLYEAVLLTWIAAGFWVWIHVNPLRHLEGYHLLEAWTRIPHLNYRALAALRAAVLGDVPREPLTRRERRWFITFAVLCVLRVLVETTLGLWFLLKVMTAQFQGVGAVLFIALMLYVLPTRGPIGRGLAWAWHPSGRSRINLAVRLAILLAVVILLLLPYPYETGGWFRILPIKKYEVHFEIEGAPIKTVPIKEGQWIKNGDVVAVIEPREFQSRLETQQAALDATVAHLALLRKRLVLLTDPPNIEEIQRFEAERRRLEAEVRKAQRELELTVVRTGLDGKVVTPYVDQKVGQFLRKGELFAVVEDARTVRIEVSVPEADIPQVRMGAKVEAVLWAYSNQTFAGKVLSIATAGNNDQKAIVVRVLAELDNPDGLLKSEMTGYAKIATASRPVWRVLVGRILRWIRVEVWSWVP